MVELAAFAGDGDGVGGERKSGLLPAERGFELAVTGLGRAARLRGHDHERAAETAFQRVEDAVDAVRVGVVDEVHAELVGLAAERVGHELRAEGGAADADAEEVGELAGGAFDLSRVDLRREAGDGFDGRLHVGGDLRVGREFRRAQPVVADHALLVGVGDGALFQGGHVGEGLGDGRRHLFGEARWRGRAAEVERDAEFREVEELLAVEVEGGGHDDPILPRLAGLATKRAVRRGVRPFIKAQADLSRRR